MKELNTIVISQIIKKRHEALKAACSPLSKNGTGEFIGNNTIIHNNKKYVIDKTGKVNVIDVI